MGETYMVSEELISKKEITGTSDDAAIFGSESDIPILGGLKRQGQVRSNHLPYRTKMKMK